MNLDSLKEIKKRLLSRWGKGFFLKSHAAGENLFPFEVSLKGPPASKIGNNFDEVRAWIGEIKKGCEKAGLLLEWKSINNRQLGRNSIPQKIIFADIEQLSRYLGKKPEFEKFINSRAEILTAFPELENWIIQNPFKLTENSEHLDRLIKILDWIRRHPRPGIYLRQLSIPGVDTKFIEKHKKLLGSWLDIVLEPSEIDENYSGAGKFEKRYGFRNKPVLIRFRILDSANLENIGGIRFSDISLTASEFSDLIPPARRVFIVENDITALAFPFVPDSLLIFGRGYNFKDFESAGWLHEKELWYWGDIDTHGFAILNQFRGSFPNTRSFLMDHDTLMSHRDHWGVETNQCTQALPQLTDEETALYEDLKSNKISPKLRLEQEFVNYSYIQNILQLLLSYPLSS